MPVLEHYRDKPAVRGAGAVENVEPGHLNHILHRRVSHQQFTRLGHHRFGTLQRRRLRQLHAGKQVTLIFLRQEAFRHRGEAERHQRTCRHRRRQRQPGTAVHPAYQPAIAVAGAVEKTVKRPPHRRRPGGTRAQQQRAEGRRQG